jgi:nucleotide-binding universal stress UspA family protein
VTIVAMTDRSERSLRVLPHAARLAQATGRELILLHVTPRPPAERVDPERAWLEHERATSAMQRELELAVVDVGVEVTIVIGYPQRRESIPHAMLRIANEHHALAIAMDSRGAGLVRRALLGSVALNLIRRSHLPVLVTGNGARPSQAESAYSVLCGCDGTASSEDAVRALGPLLHETPAGLTLARIDEAARGVIGKTRHAQLHGDLRRAARLLPRDITPELVVEAAGDRDVPGALLDLASSRGASAIALATRGDAPRTRRLVGSTTIALLERSTLPLIITHGIHG